MLSSRFDQRCNEARDSTLINMQSRLKRLATGCKILATVGWLVIAWFVISILIHDIRATTPPREAPHDWGTAAYYHRIYRSILGVSVVALLAAIPNRWLVFSRIVFSIVLIIALLPLCFSLFVSLQDFSLVVSDFPNSVFVWAIMMLFSVPWPLSLSLSFWRYRKEEEIFYA